ncbi:GNAT family N-acetyltransferase [Pectobacterium atrosepticum]|uniref:tRNA(Met) cytidine acetyltransferase TmcA n=1 Tax=Pectobacterium atrosepticum TaxID=29471 RepID=UPI00030946E3|nr:GNAT family N-acetyltransferase [Pectobacterium atrosepticum]GKV86443.1 tRNA(Met) cytidine acetyltransferase TmcA [Pectobacterium carotovorum subsp. carotovorum]ATY90047.1 tRNA(Met) cytidine acetyltransferase [Pectobacterium atrosepticum]KFX24945.1 methionine tRNA cytidine acetyltransferase [Pectobacterium atrosepticum]MCL6317346.1 tRNA(Met) cytidine acetyltransferase [Pectobacterium atrosepticum]MCL6321848.1 tRNA(Met) cytidine acetyltransferase [Pectobacterium atrosepticum]
MILRDFLHSQQQQQRYGIRRLLVLSGESSWCEEQAMVLSSQSAGDWLWVSEHAPDSVASLPASRVRTLLGREFHHAVFDARSGVDVEALAMLSGTLRAGSWLIMLVPSWQVWSTLPDEDSLRWSEHAQPIATPHFIQHFQRQLLADDDVVLWQQGQPLVIQPLAVRSDWQPAQGEPTARQQQILHELSAAESGVFVITAPRGRGKSTLAGMLTQRSRGTCWITAPSRSATDILQQYARSDAPFWAPDALLAYCRLHGAPDVDWLLIDEVAAIPSSVLTALLPYFPRILMTTTVQGYEGTGRGFLLKFCAALPQCRVFSLDDPLRWAANDPLERVLDQALLFNEPASLHFPLNPTDGALTLPSAKLDIRTECADDWLTHPERLTWCYALLCSAHYRTSPLDLRRLMDAPGMHIASAQVAGDIRGVLWLVEEGGLSDSLAHDVWAGRRRPRGNLVAQSLAAHAGLWNAPTLRARRVSRIAVASSSRRQGIGRALIADQTREAQKQALDYLSVSFGYQPDLWAFWQSCGFQLVRIGSHLEASSGCYSAMAILPLSEAGYELAQQGSQQLARDWYWLQRMIPLNLALPQTENIERDTESIALNDDDWRELAGFAFAHRPMEASFAAICRLLIHTSLPLPALRLLAETPSEGEQTAATLGLTGKKALLKRWREETTSALIELDAQRGERWRLWVLPDDAAEDALHP